MRAPPNDLAEDHVRQGLEAWRLQPTELIYQPVGGGSYHWTCRDRDDGRYFLTVDDLGTKPWLGSDPDAVFDSLGAAYRGALDLARSGLDFVVAPLPGSEGELVRRLRDRYSLAVFPLIDGRTGEFHQQMAPSDGMQLARQLARLHGARPATRVGISNPEVPERPAVEAALQDLDRPWATGPFAEQARQWLAANAAPLQSLLDTFDRLVQQVQESTPELVITHGEPHPGNLIRREEWLFLIDWDTVGLAPVERDLWFLESRCPGAIERYLKAGGKPASPTALDLYRLRWTLSDVGAYVTMFRAPHRRDADTERWASQFPRDIRLED